MVQRLRFRLSKTIPWKFIFVVVIFLVALYISLPPLPLQIKFGGKTHNITVKHPTIAIGQFKRDLEPKLGLDLQGGTQIILEADMRNVAPDQRDNALLLSRNVIERRVNLFGVSEPVIQTARNGDTYRIVVELAGITDINQAINTVGKTAKLEFHQLVENPTATESAAPQTTPTGLDGGDLERAQVVFNPQTNEPLVSFTVRKESQDKFFQKTQELVGKPMVIVLDDIPVSAPTVQQAIRDSGQITGQFTLDQAKELALQLNAGALKAPVKIVGQRNIGATLGAESIRKSIIAGAIGLAIVAIFMVINYGKLGLLADLALVIYTLVTFAIFKFIPITFTLAGIAGFILSIGMAVDANILIFERMKEERRWGKDARTAVALGFERAMTSIKASNISTIITTLILYWFGTGFVRGFALTLALGVLISMFSAIYVTRVLLQTFMYRKY